MTIHQKINCKANSLVLYSYQTPRNIMKRGYFLPERYSPEVLIPEQWLFTKEPKNAGRHQLLN